MLTMDDIFDLLADGKWHDMREVIDNSRLHDLKVKMFLDFLSEYDFVELDKKQQKVKLTPSLNKFFKKIKVLERKEAVSELEVP